MVWRVVLWCDMVWCGVVWYGVVWYGMVWCGVVWCGVVWYGMVWCGVVWCGGVWCGGIWCGVVCHAMVCYSRFNNRKSPANCQQTPTALHPRTRICLVLCLVLNIAQLLFEKFYWWLSLAIEPKSMAGSAIFSPTVRIS